MQRPLQEELTDPRVLLVDGMALLFRAFYATSYSGYILKTSAGLPTNAVYGFVKYFWDAVERFRPSHIVCCWDLGSKTFRSEKFEDYKANRPDCPEELIPQFDLVKEVTQSFGVMNVGLPGYEADDCIGTLARLYSEKADVYILTGDHDMLQLVDERIHVVIMKKGQGNYAVYTPAALFEEKPADSAAVHRLEGADGRYGRQLPGRERHRRENGDQAAGRVRLG
ncbi:hypothetical protein LJK88_39745 [Paenibacillus sp. P26]|nr:hypothetical protein LJK88_39745 [Paenibacillus sp. P26]